MFYRPFYKELSGIIKLLSSLNHNKN